MIRSMQHGTVRFPAGAPHIGLKRRRLTWPLSAVLTYSLVEPDLLRLLPANMRLIEALPDDTYWQSRHQQARVETAIGP